MHTSSFLLALAASSSFVAPARAQQALPDLHAVAKFPADALVFDEPGDGALWVRSASYKASFSAFGATIVPFLGSDAPRSFPLALHVIDAVRGSVTISDDTPGCVTREGDVARIDHFTFVEEYAVAHDSLEQRFVFPRLPGKGDLVVRLAADTELAGADLGRTLRFANELGSIEYGEAFALDAAGRKIALDSVLVDGAIELRVPASFADVAALPLVIDPIVNFTTLASTARDEIYPDVAYDLTTDKWCVVWEDVFSATDHDVLARYVTNSGGQGIFSIDTTQESVGQPKVANANAGDRFLVVATAVPAAGAASIRGRMLFAASNTVGLAFPISPLDGFFRSTPDIGGDPWSGGDTFCVVWQRPVAANDVDIEMQLVSVNGLLLGTPVYLEHAATLAEAPSISGSLGLMSTTSQRAWTVVWQELAGIGNHDIWGAQIQQNGAFLHARFPISLVGNDETAPKVSTMLAPTPSTSERPYMVVYEQQWTTDRDIVGAVLRGTSVVDAVDLSNTFEAPFVLADQYQPVVESDGYQFLVGYAERATQTSTNSDVYFSNYYFAGSRIVPCTVHEEFASSPTGESELALASMASSGGSRLRYFGVFDVPATALAYNVQGGSWDGCSGGVYTKFCDHNTITPCPCGNEGTDEHGCANSATNSGAALEGSGDASVSNDSFVLQAWDMPLNTTCLFFQGTAVAGSGFGVPFGDGRRCVIGAITRVGLKSSSDGTAQYPQLGDMSISAKGQVSFAGGTRYYQAWYRDPATFCTNGTSNLTNGVEVIWAP